MTKNESKPSIQCDKCHKWIGYRYYYGYSHRCSERVKEILRDAHKRWHSINSTRNHRVRDYGMYSLVDNLDSASAIYDPEAKSIRKEIEMKKTATDLPTPEEATRIFRTLDLASKLDNTVIAKLSRSKSKSSTPKIGELCGMDLRLDLSDIPEELRYEKYFEARTILEDILKKEVKENRP